MKSRTLLSVMVIALGIFTFGCGSEKPTPILTVEPTLEIAPTEAVPVVVETEVVQEIKTIRVGVNSNSVPPLTIIEGETYSGFEIDIANEIIIRLYDPETIIEWVPITSQERFSSLAEGQIDMLVRLALHTVGREEQVLFSGGYLLGGNSFLVFQDDGFTSVADLDGKNVAVLSYLEEELSRVADHLGFTFNPVVVETIDEAHGELDLDRADAIFHDWLLLANLMDHNVHAIIAEGSLLAPIGVAFSLDAGEFRDEVDIVLSEMISDGTWQSIFEKWIGGEVPWNVEEMLNYPPLD